MNAQIKHEVADADAKMSATNAITRSNLFALLAFAFTDPTAELAGHLIDGSYLSQLRDYYSELTGTQSAAVDALEPLKVCQAGLSKSDPDELLHALKVEYCRLFIGPAQAVVPPYETCYGVRGKDSAFLLMVSPEAVAVETAYREAGVALAGDLREPPDHFATEAEFLYYLCKKEAESWTTGDLAAADGWRRKQAAFMHAHMERWGAQFCRHVEAKSCHPFYRAVAHFTQVFIQAEGGDVTDHSGVALSSLPGRSGETH